MTLKLNHEEIAEILTKALQDKYHVNVEETSGVRFDLEDKKVVAKIAFGEEATFGLWPAARQQGRGQPVDSGFDLLVPADPQR